MEGPSPAKRLKLMDESAPIDAMSRPGGPPSSPPPPPPASAPPPGADSFPAQFGNHSANGAGTVKVEKLDPEEEDKKVNGHTLKTDEVDAFITSAMNGEHQGTEGVKAESEDEEEIAPDDVVPAEEEDLSHRDMYLDSVSRANLDFDFERLCSKSLSNINVYACLVCGKYFQGRGKGSWAYRHAVGENHRVWLNLTTEKFYVLPEGYLVSDPSLRDIIHVLNPRYDPSILPSLSLLPARPSYTLAAQPYLPGYIGLNNIRANDYANVVIHLLLHIPPVRDFFLDPRTPQLKEENKPTELVKRFGLLAKRIWNPRLFKAQASPHEFLQEVNKRSDGKFKTTEQGDPVAFLGWLLNTLHRDLGGSKKANSSVIYRAFQGEVRIQTQEVIVNKSAPRPIFDIGREIKSVRSPFLFLSLDLPATPLFQDVNERQIIPQVPLSAILAKFDGSTVQETGNTLKRHQLTRLPPYLILHIKRFTKNNFVEEKNPTIVNFPLRSVDLKDYVDPPPHAPISTLYDLVGNVPHEATTASTSSAGTGPGISKKRDQDEGQTIWKVHLRAGAGGGEQEKWFAMHDLDVDEVRKDMVFLGETVIQVWQRRDVAPLQIESS